MSVHTLHMLAYEVSGYIMWTNALIYSSGESRNSAMYCYYGGLHVIMMLMVAPSLVPPPLRPSTAFHAQVARLLSEQQPIELLRCSANPLKGGFLSLDPVVERLRELLPPRFEDLQTDFAVGVVSPPCLHNC